MSTKHNTSATNIYRFWPPAIKAAMKRVRSRQKRRAPSTTMVDRATQTPTWPDDQQQLESQKDDHMETEQTNFQFMDLPLELRREVYRHYINNLPPLMYTSPQICHEVSDITDRVLIFQMFNGLCPSYIQKRESAELAAAKLASLHDKYQGKNIRFKIELQCPTTLFPKPYAVELVREMVEQVERLRDGKLLSVHVGLFGPKEVLRGVRT
ncbi:hypothetical protein KCU81_g1169, partial [Aureobasidium melanogenum]|uniref:Uncharacterized protein n=1 Tax=Aureobasidium melanogenum (strain CBS 110374) TaxID=1043003 RepID=A0A074W9P5_AURM1